MGRPNKEGLDYFPLDIDIFEDHKILLAQELVDPEGDAHFLRLLLPYVAIRLLREIYHNGYYMRWNKEECLTLSAKIRHGITISILDKITSCLIKTGFFSSYIYNTYNILTSKGIQERWLNVVKDSNRKLKSILPEYELYTYAISSSANNDPLSANNDKKTESEVGFYDVDYLLKNYFTSSSYARTREQVAMISHMDEQTLQDWSKAFNRFLISEGTTQKQKSDWPKHFKRWLNLQNKNQNPNILFNEKSVENGNGAKQQFANNGPVKGHQPFSMESVLRKTDKLFGKDGNS